MLVNGELGTIVPVQPIFSGNSNHPLTILINLVNQAIGEFQVHSKHFTGLGVYKTGYPKKYKEKFKLYFHRKIII
jgi:hypothetical protein